METLREDSGEADEEGEVDLPLMTLPPLELGSGLTPSDVVAGVLTQLAQVEDVADSGEVEVVDHPATPLEPAREEEAASPSFSEQSPDPI